MLVEKVVNDKKWLVVYNKAIKEDGSLFFPEKLTKSFLEGQRKELGSYIYTNQYLNEILPSDKKDFKRQWLRYYEELPKVFTTFAFIDPAISLEDEACFTAFVIVSIDSDGVWYLRRANRMRITATQTVKLIFEINKIYKPNGIGVESVAYQEALMHFVGEKMKETGVFVPVSGIKRSTDVHKDTRIRSLIPRFEWDMIKVAKHLNDFEDEYIKFPRGQFKDILDALSSIAEICYNPPKERIGPRELNPNDPGYEKQYIEGIAKRKAQESED